MQWDWFIFKCIKQSVGLSIDMCLFTLAFRVSAIIPPATCYHLIKITSIPINCMLCHVEMSSTQRRLVLPTHTVYQQNSTSAGFILGCSHLQCRMQQILWQFYSVSSMWMILIRSVDPHKTLSYFWLGNGRLHPRPIAHKVSKICLAGGVWLSEFLLRGDFES